MATKIIKHKGKGSTEEMLPHRGALAQLTGGDTVQRSLSNYAKKTPSGVEPGGSIFDYGQASGAGIYAR